MPVRSTFAALILLVLVSAVSPAQSSGLSATAAFGAGAGVVVGGYANNQFQTGAVYTGDLELRLLKYLSAEIGVDNMLLDYTSYSGSGSTTSRERLTLMPFGLRGILPLANGRAELFAGAGGAYTWLSNESQFYKPSRALVQANAGGRVALDRRRRFWLGVTARFYRDVGRPTVEWSSVAGDLGFRFGR